MNQVIIGLGSNINAQQNINQAKEFLSQKFKILAESTFVQTKPIGPVKQDDFINGAVLAETNLSLEDLKKTLCELEAQLGRTKATKGFGPRTIDLDILAWNNQIKDPDFYIRDFLKKSVLELLPNVQQ